MEDLIPVINKLQDVFSAIGQQSLDLPQIVVVGSQSSGKSSVLESIVGRDFLPRGSGVVTRRPLVLQLYCVPPPGHTPSSSSSSSLSAPDSNSSHNSHSSKDGRKEHSSHSHSHSAHSNHQQSSHRHGGGDSEPFYPLDDTEDEHQYQSQTQHLAGHVTGRSGRRGERGNRATHGHHQEDPPSSSSSSAEEWGEFLHLPGEKFTDFALIREEIQRETDRVVGTNKGISKESINLKIFSPHVLNLTVVDLPGVTRVPVGDQPEDIENQIKGMCLEFISNPNAVILAVSAANQDISNSDGLQLARLVDPEGVRTIGVLTKVDIMDQGTDAVDILQDRAGLQLRRGYVAIINRSQQDILNKVTVRQGLAKEEQYFSAHPKYRSIMQKCGTKTMTTRLNQILMHHIRDCLPGIRSKIVYMVTEVKTSLESFGESPDDLTPPKQGEYLLKTLSKFASNVTDIVDGKGSDVGVEMQELCGGARILYVFNEIFARRLMAVNPFDLLKDQDIQTAMSNSNGVRHPLFIPESSFDLLVRKQITRLDTPGVQCVDLVYDEMIRMCLQVDASELSRFPTLRDRVFECIHKLLRECVKPTQTMISNLVKVELAFINTSHPDFIGGKKAILAQRNDNNNGNTGNNGNGGNGSGGSAEGQPSNGGQGQGQEAKSSKGIENGSSSSSSSSSGSSNSGSATGGASSMVATVTATKVEQQEQANPEYQNNSSSNSNSNASGLPGFFNLFSKQTGATATAPPHLSPQRTSQRGASSSSSSLDPYAYPSQGGGGSNSSPFPHSQSGGSSDSQAIRLRQVPEKMRSSEKPSGVEKVEIQVIKTLISSYFDIVKKNFTDMVPKVIMHFLVNSFKDGLQNELISTLYRESMFTDLLKETDDVAAKRQACREMRDLLLKAMEIVNEVRDYTVFDK